jgi:hypothetical protein
MFGMFRDIQCSPSFIDHPYIEFLLRCHNLWALIGQFARHQHSSQRRPSRSLSPRETFESVGSLNFDSIHVYELISLGESFTGQGVSVKMPNGETREIGASPIDSLKGVRGTAAGRKD